jgi:protocatechuate 3,4-dioxygenase beta subunit
MLGNYLSVTDKDGNYIFKNVIPGNYFLEIDRSTTAINDIPTVVFPAAVSLINEENIFNFGLTTAAKVQGYIRLSETEEKVCRILKRSNLKKGEIKERASL